MTDETMTDHERALRVLVTDKKIARFLRDHDPKALQQAEAALGLTRKRGEESVRNGLRNLAGIVEDALTVLANNDKEDPDDVMVLVQEKLDEMSDWIETLEERTRDERQRLMAKATCEFEQRDGHEWYCTTHGVSMIGPEPVNCTVRRGTL